MQEATATLVTLGSWPRLEAQILRSRLEHAGIAVLTAGDGPEARVRLAVGPADTELARAVVNELDTADEVPDTSPEAYLARIEEHLEAVSQLLDELRTRLGE